MGVFELRPQAVARGGCSEAENRVPDAETAFLDGVCLEPSTFSDGHLDDSRKAVLERSLRPLRTKEAVWGHRASMIADLAQSVAETKKDRNCGWRLQPDELSHEFFGTVQFVLEFAEAEVWKGEGFGWDALAFFRSV